ncbi:hypothetical protein H0H93_001760, partial [Arthromyces matolae]
MDVLSLSYRDTMLAIVAAALITHVIFKRTETQKLIHLAILLLGTPAFLTVLVARHSSSLLRAVLVAFPTFWAVLSASIVFYRLSPFHPLAKYPGPILCRASKLYIAFLSLGGKQYTYYQRLHDQYGDVVRIGPNELSIRDVNAIGPIMGPQGFPKGPFWDGRIPEVETTRALIALRNKMEHTRRRRPWTRAFNTSALKGYEDIITKRCVQFVDGVGEEKGAADMSKWISYFTYDFMNDFAFGGGTEMMRDGDVNGLWHLLEAGQRSAIFMSHVPWFGRFCMRFPSLAKDLKAFRAHAKQCAIARRQRGSDYKDLFYHIMNEGGDAADPPTMMEAVSDGAVPVYSFSNVDCAPNTEDAIGGLAILAGADTTSSALANLSAALPTELCPRCHWEKGSHHDSEHLEGGINEQRLFSVILLTPSTMSTQSTIVFKGKYALVSLSSKDYTPVHQVPISLLRPCLAGYVPNQCWLARKGPKDMLFEGDQTVLTWSSSLELLGTEIFDAQGMVCKYVERTQPYAKIVTAKLLKWGEPYKEPEFEVFPQCAIPRRAGSNDPYSQKISQHLPPNLSKWLLDYVNNLPPPYQPDAPPTRDTCRVSFSPEASSLAPTAPATPIMLAPTTPTLSGTQTPDSRGALLTELEFDSPSPSPSPSLLSPPPTPPRLWFQQSLSIWPTNLSPSQRQAGRNARRLAWEAYESEIKALRKRAAAIEAERRAVFCGGSGSLLLERDDRPDKVKSELGRVGSKSGKAERKGKIEHMKEEVEEDWLPGIPPELRSEGPFGCLRTEMKDKVRHKDEEEPYVLDPVMHSDEDEDEDEITDTTCSTDVEDEMSCRTSVFESGLPSKSASTSASSLLLDSYLPSPTLSATSDLYPSPSPSPTSTPLPDS